MRHSSDRRALARRAFVWALVRGDGAPLLTRLRYQVDTALDVVACSRLCVFARHPWISTARPLCHTDPTAESAEAALCRCCAAAHRGCAARARPGLSDVQAVADEGETMPPVPKILDGGWSSTSRSVRAVTARAGLSICRAMRTASPRPGLGAAARPGGRARARRRGRLTSPSTARPNPRWTVLEALAGNGRGIHRRFRESACALRRGGRWRVVIDPVDGQPQREARPSDLCALGRGRRRPVDGRCRARLRLRPRQRRGVGSPGVARWSERRRRPLRPRCRSGCERRAAPRAPCSRRLQP